MTGGAHADLEHPDGREPDGPLDNAPDDAGDDAEFTAILHRLWDELLAYIGRRVRPDEQHLVQDLANQAAEDLYVQWRKRRGAIEDDLAAAMVRQSVKGDLANHRAKQTRRRTDPVAVDDQALADHADPAAESELSAVLGRVDHERLLAELPRLLTQRQRQVVLAVDVDGLTQARAARQLGLSVRGLQEQRKAALRRLHRHLTSPPADTTPAGATPTPTTSRDTR
ncbi:sigma-70 family RNA polymerase sigma factor [Saccharothrix sp.]|uniref:RNA polymerase sigma factor n=1 Tax=Saccharothrix sp. TaxID=1873460 RepID=UPI0028114DE8|nr:sigma-70 family RNA polymerase sigma factor [Saccharothrix sp.]